MIIYRKIEFNKKLLLEILVISIIQSIYFTIKYFKLKNERLLYKEVTICNYLINFLKNDKVYNNSSRKVINKKLCTRKILLKEINK